MNVLGFFFAVEHVSGTLCVDRCCAYLSISICPLTQRVTVAPTDDLATSCLHLCLVFHSPLWKSSPAVCMDGTDQGIVGPVQFFSHRTPISQALFVCIDVQCLGLLLVLERGFDAFLCKKNGIVNGDWGGSAFEWGFDHTGSDDLFGDYYLCVCLSVCMDLCVFQTLKNNIFVFSRH